MAKEYKVNIFDLMKRLDSYDYFMFDSLTEEQLKEVSPYMMMRWMSSSADDMQLIKLNAFVNLFAFNFGDKHKDLLLKLLAVSSSKNPERYKFIKKKKAGGSQSMKLEIIKQFHNYSTREALDVLELFNSDNVLMMAESLGYQKEEVKKLKKELK